MPMKKGISPVVAVIAIVVVAVAVVAYVLIGPSRSSKATIDTGLPPEVVKRIKEQGPQPMPPMPMPNGGTVNVPLQNGPPSYRK